MLFAFTIVDDTDGQTLDVVRVVYDELAALGLKTTKTVWVAPPAEPPGSPWDEGDTLENADHVAYLRRLQDNGFEIALHNVSSRSNRRQSIAAAIERFRDVFGHYPKMNIHHEKNRENLYFEVANDPARLPGSFRSPVFRRLRRMLRYRAPESDRPPKFHCSGEDPESAYFWGDICKDKIRYVRTNVFLDRLNTIRGCPAMPLSFADTPYVNYWFYSSEGQDAAHFNRMLSERNVRNLRNENGSSILYTHFGKGFVRVEGGRPVLNEVTRTRLRHIATQEHGWFVPAGELLDRLLAFQKVLVASFAGSFALRNDNEFEIRNVTVLTRPRATYYSTDGAPIVSDELGRLIVRELPARRTAVFLAASLSGSMKTWNAPTGAPWRADVKEVWSRLRDAADGIHARKKEASPQPID